MALLSLDRPRDALAHAKVQIRLVPDDPYPHGAMGAALEMDGRLKDALACYDKMLQISPIHIAARIKKVAMLHATDREKESDECINEFLTAEPLDGNDDKARGVLETLTGHLKDIMYNIKASDEDYSEYAAPGLTEMADILIGDETKEPTTESETLTNHARSTGRGKRDRASIL